MSHLLLSLFPSLDWVGVVAHLLEHADQLLLWLVLCTHTDSINTNQGTTKLTISEDIQDFPLLLKNVLENKQTNNTESI